VPRTDMRYAPRESLFVLLLGTAACASMATMGLAPPPLPSFRATPQIDSSKFETSTKVNGVELPITMARAGSSYFIRSWVDKAKGGVEHQLYAFYAYSGDWKFWNRANGEDANVLKFTEISHDVGSCYGGCSLYENFGVDLPDSLLRAHPTGYQIKVYAKSGDSMILTVSPNQIAAQLRVVDSLKALAK
jgi:hypothetical protein